MKQSALIKAAGATTWLLLATPAPLLWALSVSPPHTEVHLLPGGASEAVITVTNPHAEAYNVELSEKPWFVYPDNKQIHVEDWLHLPWKKNFRLKPGKSREVKIKITCPKDAVGELMGMVSVSYQGMKPSMITPMISTAVYLDVTGTERNTGEIVALVAGSKYGRFQVSAQIRATGNIRLRASGMVRLLNEQGQSVADYKLVEATPLFPGTNKEYATTGPDQAPKPGRYTLSADLQSGTLNLKKDQVINVKGNGEVE